MTEKSKRHPCDVEGHSFVPKRQQTDFGLNGVPREQNVSELFCERCGTVCFLNAPPPQPVLEGVN